tara:strand:+ start:503 stop:733 length:231 start_codon:yes stop_codon:yes gene_type:complete
MDDYLPDNMVMLPPDILSTRMEQVRKMTIDLKEKDKDSLEFLVLIEGIRILLDSCAIPEYDNNIHMGSNTVPFKKH